ncbi:MAG: hypothetical protein US42_C0008G0025 [Candidatus Magasanikbacteria bacterium GW2011_GWC2_37_14]|uniref:DUF559 domain-containing protein n=1 Tax=Candidatus Magasanikbacteria bacterium GW2011_GWC2_37_14 TaxID=1619046 RepID=A0A0G0ITL0_9BACT|nr:MAG: hypothetical protein US42_C0008G0025 [Candidatus Magasanikbacteria bacterium GW2011_GWC2_37_14]
MTKIYARKDRKIIRNKLRQNMTKSETVFWKYAKRKNLGYLFRRQYSIGKYIVDFYCPALKLIIEIDGITHLDEDVYNNDVIRQKYLENLGHKILRFKSEEILLNLHAVLENLSIYLKEREKQLQTSASPLPSLRRSGTSS